MRAFIVFAFLVAGCAAQLGHLGELFTYFQCRSHHNCDRDPTHYECGTDKVTYRNRCEFTRAACKNSDLHVDYYGKCSDGTSSGNPVLSGEQAVLDYFCVALAHEDCTGNKKVCGSDGKTYPNECEFEKNKCTHRQLKVAAYGECSS